MLQVVLANFSYLSYDFPIITTGIYLKFIFKEQKLRLKNENRAL